MRYISPEFLLYSLAILYIVIALPAFFAPKKFNETMTRLMKNADLIMMMSLWTILVGFIYLSNFWKLDGTRNMLISIIGWLAVIKGIVLLWFPSLGTKMYIRSFAGSSALVVGVMSIVLAALLIYWGMYMF